jgi:hypothetical protein
MAISAVQPEHIESIRVWRNEQLDVLRQAHPISVDEQTAYFDRVIWHDMDSTTPRQILVAIHLSGEFIGYGGLVHLSWSDQRGEVSFLIRTDQMKNRLPSTVSSPTTSRRSNSSPSAISAYADCPPKSSPISPTSFPCSNGTDSYAKGACANACS